MQQNKRAGRRLAAVVHDRRDRRRSALAADLDRPCSAHARQIGEEVVQLHGPPMRLDVSPGRLPAVGRRFAAVAARRAPAEPSSCAALRALRFVETVEPRSCCGALIAVAGIAVRRAATAHHGQLPAALHAGRPAPRRTACSARSSGRRRTACERELHHVGEHRAAAVAAVLRLRARRARRAPRAAGARPARSR